MNARFWPAALWRGAVLAAGLTVAAAGTPDPAPAAPGAPAPAVSVPVTQAQPVTPQEPPDQAGTTPALARQVQRGAELYFLACVICHGDRLEGVSAPALSGPPFRTTYEGLSARSLAEWLIDQMPLDRPGSLSPAEALDLTAFLLRENGAALPATGLSAEASADPIHFADPVPAPPTSPSSP